MEWGRKNSKMKYLIIFPLILLFAFNCPAEEKFDFSNLDIYLKDKELEDKRLLYNTDLASYTETTIFTEGYIYFYRKHKLNRTFREHNEHNFKISDTVYRIHDENGTIIREICEYKKPIIFNKKWIQNLSCKDRIIILSKNKWVVGEGEFKFRCQILTAKNKEIFRKKRKIIKAICESEYGNITVYYAEGLGIFKASEGSTNTTLVKIFD